MSKAGTSLVLVSLLLAACASHPPAADSYASLAAAAPPAAVVGHLGPDDLLDITVLQAPELSREVRVAADGTVSMPLIGAVPASGKTARELEAAIAARLRGRYMVDPQVSVEVKEARSRSVYVLGEVRKPGAFPILGTTQLTVLRALALGGGLTSTAAKGSARIIRVEAGGRRTEIPVDIGRIQAGRATDVALRTNDILLVPNSSGKSVASGVLDAVLRVVTLRGVLP